MILYGYIIMSCSNAEPFPTLHISKGYFSLNSVRFDQERTMEEDPADVRHIFEPLSQLFYVPNSVDP